MKTIFVLVGLIALCLAQSSTSLENIQQIMNGAFAQAGLAAPTQAINCFDESDATTALDFAGTILTQVSKEEIFSISGTINNFKKNFPSSVVSCLEKDPEMVQLQAAYHVTSSTFSSDPIEYVLENLSSLKSSASTGASDYNSGDFEALGTLAGQMIQSYVSKQDEDFFFSGDALTDVQQILNGAFAQAGLAAPTQAINCFDESDATTALNFIDTILTQVSKEEIFSISGTINSFKNNFPSSVVSCLEKDSEMVQLQAAYHVTSSTFSSDPIEYVLENLSSLKSSASTGANDFNSGDYEALGTLAGQMVQSYVSKQDEDFFFSGDALTDVQQILNGAFAQAGLAAPTQAINCFDESDATTALNFIGTILTQVSKEEIFSISGTINNFKKNFPSSVVSCLEKDSEMVQLQAAYHVTSSTFSSDPIEYVLENLSSLKSSASTGANDFNSGDYEALGTLAGQMVQSYVSKQDEDFFFSGDALTDVQQILNGAFAQVGLPAPTQAINCFDESDATTALNFAGTILTQVSKEDIFSISGTINSFKKNFPSSVVSCLEKDSEMIQLQAAYHLTSSTFSSDPIEYVLENLSSLKSSASTGANDFNSGDYEALGTLAGQMVQSYVSKQAEDFFFSGDALTDLQQIMDGFFAQAGLAAPTQAINCFDESDATTALNFAGTILTQVSKEEIFSISGTINNFKNSFPASVATCLKNDPEMAQVQTAYHITSSTFSSDPIEYVLTHLGSLKSSASTGANDFNSGNYEALGTLAGQMVQQYVGQQSGSNGDNGF